MIRSREQRKRRRRRGRPSRAHNELRHDPLRRLVRTLAQQAAREMFARELAAQRSDRPEVTLQ
jgi:hypothetical protein